MSNNVAETTPAPRDYTTFLLTTARLYLNSPPDAPKYCRPINPNLNNYHSDPMKSGIIFCKPHITDWWCLDEGTHPHYAYLSNLTPNIFPIKLVGLVMKATVSHQWDVVSRGQTNSTAEYLLKNDIVR
jgi:hypothetical protein